MFFPANISMLTQKYHLLETLAFRALILQGMQKEDEALAGMKEILKNFKNFKNYTVWHIYGMINK